MSRQDSAQIILPANLDQHAGYQQWLKQSSRQKKRLPPAAFGLIKEWAETGKDDCLAYCTFRHIVAFFNKEKELDARGFKVACADYGYMTDELTALKAEGKTAKDVALEILARGVYNDA